MSTDVYIDFSPKPRPKTPPDAYAYTAPPPEKFRDKIERFRTKENQWYQDSETVRIGYLYTMSEIPIPGYPIQYNRWSPIETTTSLLDYLRDLSRKYRIFNAVALSELRGVLQIFDRWMVEANKKGPEVMSGLDPDTFNDYLTEADAVALFPELLGKYWYTRVD